MTPPTQLQICHMSDVIRQKSKHKNWVTVTEVTATQITYCVV